MSASGARRLWLAIALLVLALAALVLWWRGDVVAAPNATPAPRADSGKPRFFDPVAAAGLPLPASSVQRRKLLIDHVQLADQTYCSYRRATRYPPGSRPASEQPDQLYPNLQIAETQPMRQQGGATNARVALQSSQSRVHLAAGESVSLSLRALDEHGAVLPLAITRAQAQGLTFNGARPAPLVTLAFADDGRLADAAAGDGAYSAMLTPAQTALAAFNGTIRIEVRYNAGGAAGLVFFDVLYSPELPAIWAGPVREGLDNGALAYYLKAEVRQAGRYIVNGRLDDAAGRPVALLTFNDLLPTGPVEIKLSAFGKLLRDLAPAMPLTLRDVDGYLLKENADPDRALMPRLDGKVVTGKAQPLSNFSDAEWQSEERTRHLDEFARDLARARQALAGADPALPAPPSICLNDP